MSNLALEYGLVSLTPTADHSDKRGFAVKASTGSAALIAAITDVPLGVITEGAPTSGKDSVAICGSGLVVKVKLDATPGSVVLGSYLTTTATGTFVLDDAAGSRAVTARALEAGAANELIRAVLINPVMTLT